MKKTIAVFLCGLTLSSYAESDNTFERPLPPMTFTSLSFKHEGNIPFKYTCDGKNISPGFKIQYVPKNAKSLVLLAVDKEASQPPDQDIVWFVYNIAPSTTTIAENQLPTKSISGRNSDGSYSYQGLCPKDVGLHHYYFNLYALDIVLPEAVITLRDASDLMQDHLVGFASTMGSYTRR